MYTQESIRMYSVIAIDKCIEFSLQLKIVEYNKNACNAEMVFFLDLCIQRILYKMAICYICYTSI